MSRWKSSDAIGQPVDRIFNIINEETRQPAINPVHKVLKEGTVGSLANHIALIAKDGTETSIEDSAAPIKDAAGKLTGAVMVFHDVTKRRQAEAALRKSHDALQNAQQELKRHASNLEQTVGERTAELREKNGELEAFSYSVSHDMRSPLRAMQGYAAALLADHKPNLNEEGRYYLERIHKAAARMDLLIQEVLTYSRVSNEKLTFQPVDLERLISEVVQSYPDFQTPKAIITVKGPLPRVVGNEALVTQVISNLIVNAIKFVKPGETPSIFIHGESTETLVRVWVEDNGIGIDPMHYKRIFEIFGRVYGDKQFEGTGIGLAIAKKAVERMGGEIGVESQLNQGSRFWFTLKKE
jgi:PAS domain S-box-containing protein